MNITESRSTGVDGSRAWPIVSGVLSLAALVGGCRATPAEPVPARAVAPEPTTADVALRASVPRLIAELLEPAGGRVVAPPVAVIELELPGQPGGRGDTGQAAWIASRPARRDGRGVVTSPSGTASTLRDDRTLVVDLDQSIPDLGVRLVLARDATGSWSGTWQRITIAGPVAGGPVRAYLVEPAPDGPGR